MMPRYTSVWLWFCLPSSLSEPPLLLGGPPLQTAPVKMGKPVEIDAAASTAALDLTEVDVGKQSTEAELAKNGGDIAGDGMRIDPSKIAAADAITGLLLRQENQQAIDLLEPVLQADPGNRAAARNLAVAYNNLALKQADNRDLALDSLWRSYCLGSENSGTVSNINRILRKSGSDPANFAQRVAEGDKQSKQGCLYGAFAEYSCALSLPAHSATSDARAAVQKKLEAIKKLAQLSSTEDMNGALYIKSSLQI